MFRITSLLLILLILSSSSPPAQGALVEYNFTIGYFVASPDGHPVNVLGINGQVPSPTIHVTQGDTLRINLWNDDPAHVHSLHWHGLSMRSSPVMDGVIGLTQCGLRPGMNMIYEFLVEDHPGTNWYHTHGTLATSGARGIAGLLLIHPPPSPTPIPRDLPLLLQDWAHEPPSHHYASSRAGHHEPMAQSALLHNVAFYKWTSALMNGYGGRDGGVYSVSHAVEGEEEGGGTRMRICNGGENFALRVSVDFHRLVVVATDGVDTEPLEVDAVILHLGERYDVMLKKNYNPKDSINGVIIEEEKNFWIRAHSLEDDQGAQVVKDHYTLGILRYHPTHESADSSPHSTSTNLPTLHERLVQTPIDDTFEYISTFTQRPAVILNCFDVAYPRGRPSCLPVTALTTHSRWRSEDLDRLAMEDPDENHEVSFMFLPPPNYGHFTRVSAGREDVVAPSMEDHRSKGPNGEVYTQFVMPGRPTLYHHPISSSSSSDGTHPNSLFLNITTNSHIQLIFNHEGHGAHPMHLHGYKFIVAASHEAPISRCSFSSCSSPEDWFAWPVDRGVVEDTVGAARYVLKDTVVMPFGGYVVVRFRADNPGDWVVHCHTDYHLADGMGVILRDAPKLDTTTGNVTYDRRRQLMPPSFPTCTGREYQALDSTFISATTRPSCQCLPPIDTDSVHLNPREGWLCGTSATCRHAAVGKTLEEQKIGARGLSTKSQWESVYQSEEEEREIRLVQRVIGWVVSYVVCMLLLLVIFRVRIAPRPLLGGRGGGMAEIVRVMLMEEFPYRINGLNFVCAVGLGAMAGLIYFDSGMRDLSERQVDEQVSLVFWQCAFWSISTVYGSVVSYHSERWVVVGGCMVYVPEEEVVGEDLISYNIAVPKKDRGQGACEESLSEISVISNETLKSTPNIGNLNEEDRSIHSNSLVSTDMIAILKLAQKVSSAQINKMAPPVNNTISNIDIHNQKSFSSINQEVSRRISSITQHTSPSIKPTTNTLHTNSIQEGTACTIWQYHLARFLISILLSSVWPILFRLIIDSFTGISSSFGRTMLCGVILALNAQVFESMGRMIAELAGPAGVAIGVAFASIFSQTLVIAGGFYKTVKSPLFAWIGTINGIKYGFTSIAIIEFSHKQSYWVGNTGPIPILGYTWSSIEFMGSFITMKERGVVVVDSMNPPTVTVPILCLCALIGGFRVLCYLLALWHASKTISLTSWYRAKIAICKRRKTTARDRLSRTITINQALSRDQSESLQTEADVANIRESIIQKASEQCFDLRSSSVKLRKSRYI